MNVVARLDNRVGELVDEYLKSLMNNYRFGSENTIRSIKSDLNRFLAYGDSQKNLSAEKVFTEGFVLEYIAELRKTGLSDRSLSRHLSTLRKWFSWLELVAKDIELEISISHIKGPRLPNLLPKALSVDEIDSFFLQRKKSIKSWIDYRDIALFELAYSSGVRVSELVSIDEPAGKKSLGSVNLEKMEVEVLGKGGKWRRLPIGEKAKDAIDVWLQHRKQVLFDKRGLPIESNPLFINKFGKRLSVRGVQRRFSIHSLRSNSRLSVTPHMLRHSFASHILQSSKNLRAVQELLGHTNVTSTQIYTKLDYQFLSEVYDKSHPRAKKKK